jgi:transcriptional regulator of acetoin/glycerol metabolism
MERAIIMADGKNLDPDDFQISSINRQQGDIEFDSYNLEEVEKNIIQKVLKTNKGNISKAAGELGLTRTSLYRRLEKYGL